MSAVSANTITEATGTRSPGSPADNPAAPVTPDSPPDPNAPVIVVGAGPVGIRLVQELERQHPGRLILLFGGEPWKPYNRVKLSSLLAGEISEADIDTSETIPLTDNITALFNAPIREIDPEHRVVTGHDGSRYPYSKLVLATGSRPFVPPIPGVGLSGIFSFRDLSDAQQLLARTASSRHTLVVGGGLLGLEAAKAMCRHHTEVTVVEHANHVMFNQLDSLAASLLADSLEESGVAVMSKVRVQEFIGEHRLEGALLSSGETIPCDTVVLSTGIVPNIDLAKAAGLNTGRGVIVNDQMQSSDPDIYAIGECAEHRGTIYGLVAPGYDQASVAAAHIASAPTDSGTPADSRQQAVKFASYEGSVAATSLKVVGLPVFSMGDIQDRDFVQIAHRYSDPDSGTYRKLTVDAGKLVGVVSIGPWGEIPRLREAVIGRRQLYPWQLWRFRRTGTLWGDDDTEEVASWPRDATVCNCTGITIGGLQQALARGCQTQQELSKATGAGTVCGSCKPLLVNLAGSGAPDPVSGWRPLVTTSVLAGLLALLFLLPLAVPYNSSVQDSWRWDQLWRDGWIKQMSGFTLLGLSLLLAMVGLRKRLRRFTFIHFDIWRLVHVLIGAVAIAALVSHTGLRVGSGLNALLMSCFVGLLLSGSLLGSVIALEHRLAPALVRRYRRLSLWSHILLLWPVPVLLGFHVLKSYYF